MEFKYKNDDLIQINDKKPEYLKDNMKGDVYHRTYLDYLHLGYANHYGIEVKPDFIWFTILNEISRLIKESPETYRSLFTSSDEKVEISVQTGDPIQMPIDELLDRVFKLVPSELGEHNVILNFSTTTNRAKVAFSTAFLEAASPYYCYSMYLCGYNKIKVLGTIEDYRLMVDVIENLTGIFENTPIERYLKYVLIYTRAIIHNFTEEVFWKDIFYVKVCGSGHQEEVHGWFVNFFADFGGYKFIEAYPKHISVIEYENKSTGRFYKMEVGILSSKIEDGYLIPDFDFGINEIIK